MKANWSTRLVQRTWGVFCTLFLLLPYVRRIRGRLPVENRLYVCNHVSLLDTLLVGSALFTRRRLPFLVLGDRATWHKSWARRSACSRVGYLIDRGRPVKSIITDLRDFAGHINDFNLLVFPEGTRGDGVTLGTIQPGIFYVAKEAGVPIVPVRIDGMEKVSTKGGPFRMFRGLRKVTITFGEEFGVGARGRDEFLAEVKRRLEGAD